MIRIVLTAPAPVIGALPSCRRARAGEWRQVARVGLALALTLVQMLAMAQGRFDLAPDAYAVYQRWVLATCIGGDEQALAADLRRYASALAPAFQRAIVEGPLPEEIREVRTAANALYERRAKFPLNDVGVTGIGREDMARFRAVSRQQFVDDQVRRFTTGYRANAVAALGTIGGPDAQAALARIERNPRDPLASAARDALGKLRSPR